MKSFAVTDIGKKRTINQDYVYNTDDNIGRFSNLYIVADGMGGHNAGDMASRICVETVCSSIADSEFTTPVSILEEAVRTSNKKVMEVAGTSKEYEGMGTTLVISTILDGVMYVANIGDSRLYLLRESLEQITEDHSLVEEMVKSGELAKENVRSHPNKNIITRALGIGNGVEADYFQIEVMENDIILMCSDGLTNMIEDIDIEYTIKSNRDNPQKAMMELLSKANEAGGRDNITVLVVKV
ncbi:MAG: Stp1/IreP family PP2C-type Ser/Thr phosphatase [Lachnospiraceae bacterium]|nr:Stp1/IreP family PP2C-type Ser/Thr phosphatase [Lachnospiraceae bacterium]